MGHECKNTEVGVGRDAQVEVIPWTMGRGGGVDLSIEFDRTTKQNFLESGGM